MPRQCLKVIVSQTKSVKWAKSPGQRSGRTDRQTNRQTFMISLKMHPKEVQRPSGHKVHQNREQISICQTRNCTKFCNNPTRSVRDIHNQKFVPPDNVGQNSPKFFRGCYSPKPLTMQDFVAIDKKMPEISAIKNLCSRKSGPKFTKIFLGMLLHKTPNQPKFRQTDTPKTIQHPLLRAVNMGH